MRQAPKSATPRSGRLRRDCDAILGRNPVRRIHKPLSDLSETSFRLLPRAALLPFRQSEVRELKRRALHLWRVNRRGAAARNPTASQRQRQFETPPASSGRPIKTLAGSTASASFKPAALESQAPFGAAPFGAPAEACRALLRARLALKASRINSLITLPRVGFGSGCAATSASTRASNFGGIRMRTGVPALALSVPVSVVALITPPFGWSKVL